MQLERAFEELGLRVRPLRPGSSSLSNEYLVLDGVGASFVLSESIGLLKGSDSELYDVAWSANVPHHIDCRRESPCSDDGEIFVRRWDDVHQIRRIMLSAFNRDRGASLVAALDRASVPRGKSVVEFALERFRELRESLGVSSSGDVQLVRAFHGLLSGAAGAADSDRRRRFLAAATLRDAVPERLHAELSGVLDKRLTPGLTEGFFRPDPATHRRLDASLLLEHAAGALYQEAHLELERSALQQRLFFVEGTPAKRPRGSARGLGIHYTPPGLARAVAELSMREMLGKEVSGPFLVLDPACGSGVFLVETERLFQDRARRGLWVPTPVEYYGFDRSAAATEMARCAMSIAAQSEQRSVAIKSTDSLSTEWPRADLVLMNPPFVSWQDLDQGQRATVTNVCETRGRGRPDLAMAFVLKAIRAVRTGGMVATLIPSALLETRAGEQWRAALADLAQVVSVIRYEGQDVFPQAMVEVSVVLLRRRDRPDAREKTRFVLSQVGHAGELARWLQRARTLQTGGGEGFEVYFRPREALTPRSWLPRPQATCRIMSELIASGVPRGGSLFWVMQGIRSGADDVFVIQPEELRRYEARERKWFRPLAGSRSIVRGRLIESRFIFYPYDIAGLALRTEKSVRDAVPTFWRERLTPGRAALSARPKPFDPWWALTRHRDWLLRSAPRVVSTYFGWSGHFAFDEMGKYVVGQGYAWILKKQRTWVKPEADKDGPQMNDEDLVDEVTLRVGFAYAALFNSRIAELLLEQVSERVQGGQFDLSPRYVNDLPVPNLASPTFDHQLLRDLDAAGRALAAGEKVDDASLSSLAARAYGVPIQRWPLRREE